MYILSPQLIRKLYEIRKLLFELFNFLGEFFFVATRIVENNRFLLGRGPQSVAHSGTIKKKDNLVTEKSALNDLSFKSKSYLIIKNIF